MNQYIVITTTFDNKIEAEKIILNNHSYETPQIVAYDIIYGYDEYLKWIGDETR